MHEQGTDMPTSVQGTLLTKVKRRSGQRVSMSAWSLWVIYLTPNNSTSKMRVALGGMTPPAPRAP
jgi:hypothetical protein